MLWLKNSVWLKGTLTETHINLGRVFTERRQLQDLKVIPSRPSSTGMQRSTFATHYLVARSGQYTS